MHEAKFESGVWGLSWEEAEGDSAVQGAACFSKDEGAQLDIPFGSVLGSDMGIIPNRSVTAKYVFGITRKSEHIVLVDCDGNNTTFHFPGVEHQTVRANLLWYSKKQFNPDEKLTSCDIDLSHLLLWYGKSIVKDELKLDDGKFLSETVSVNTEDLAYVPLYSDEEISVNLRPASKRNGQDLEEVRFNNKCSLRLESSRPLSYDEMMRYVTEIQRFISFCMGWYAQIESICMVNESGIQIESYGRYIENENELKKSVIHEMPLPYRKIHDKTQMLIKNWLHGSEEFNAAKSVFVPLATLKQSFYINLQFLAAAQTLEALARDGRETKEMTDEQFAERLRTISESIEDEDVRAWADNKLKYCNRVSQGRLIKDLYDFVGPYAKEIFPKKSAFVGKHVDMRNNIAHQNPNAKDLQNDFLFYHMHGVILLCYAAVMRKLGFDEEETALLLNDSNFRWYLKDKAAELYQKK